MCVIEEIRQLLIYSFFFFAMRWLIGYFLRDIQKVHFYLCYLLFGTLEGRITIPSSLADESDADGGK